MVCAGPAPSGEAYHESESAGGSRAMGIEAVVRVALGSEFCSGTSELAAKDACIAGCPPYWDCRARAREEQGGYGFADVTKEGGLVRVAWA